MTLKDLQSRQIESQITDYLPIRQRVRSRVRPRQQPAMKAGVAASLVIALSATLPGGAFRVQAVMLHACRNGTHPRSQRYNAPLPLLPGQPDEV